jgi:hypothetical protein
LKRAIAEDFVIGDAVQSHASGKAKIFEPSLRCKGTRQAQDDFVCHRLDRGRQIHVTLFERGFIVAARDRQKSLRSDGRSL